MDNKKYIFPYSWIGTQQSRNVNGVSCFFISTKAYPCAPFDLGTMRKGVPDMRKTAITLLATLVATPGLAAEVCERPLNIGHEEWAPFEFSGNGETLKGINVEIHKAIAEKTGCDITWVKSPWKRLLRQVEQGELDVANTASITEERSAYANFSTSYLSYEAVLFLGADDTAQYDSLRAFMDAGNDIAIARGYAYGDEADTLLAKDQYADQVEVMNKPELSVRMVAAGRIDGTIGNRYTLGYTAREDGVADKIRATDTVVQSDPVHFMFSKESVPQKVIDAYDEAITELKADGTIQKIVDDYTGQAGS